MRKNVCKHVLVICSESSGVLNDCFSVTHSLNLSAFYHSRWSQYFLKASQKALQIYRFITSFSLRVRGWTLGTFRRTKHLRVLYFRSVEHIEKQFCQGAWEAHTQGFAETPWIQLVPSVSLQYSLNQLSRCRATAKSRSMCTADCFLPAHYIYDSSVTYSPTV